MSFGDYIYGCGQTDSNDWFYWQDCFSTHEYLRINKSEYNSKEY